MTEVQLKIGQALAAERKRRGLILEQVSQELKISPAHLGHVEAGDPSKLPQAPYFDLFARSYASLLGIDYDATVRAIRDELTAADQALAEAEAAAAGPARKRPGGAHAPRTTGAGGGGSRRWLAYVAGGAAALIILTGGAYQLFFNHRDATAAKPAQEAAELSRPATPEAGSGESDPTAYQYPTQVDPEQQELELRLITTGQSWVSVKADGDTVLSRLLPTGQDSTVTARYRLQVSVGAPAAVKLILNGQEVDLRNDNGDITDVEITPLNLEQILAGARPDLTANSRLEPGSGSSATEDRTGADQNVVQQGDRQE